MTFELFPRKNKGCFRRFGKFISVATTRIAVSLDVNLDISKKYDVLYDRAIKAIMLKESDSKDARKFHTIKSTTFTATTSFHKIMPKGRYYWDDDAQYFKRSALKSALIGV